MARATIEGTTKTELIRGYLAEHPEQGPKGVVAGMLEQGIEVTGTLVSQVKYGKKYGAGNTSGAKRRRRAAARVASAGASTNSAALTKADQIREVAKTMGKRVRPRDVRAALAAKGIDVSRAQISNVLRGMGLKRRRRRRKAAAAAAPAARSVAISIDDLVAAKKLVGQVGSIEKVKEALSALAKLT